MPIFRKRISQTTLTWLLTALACAAMIVPALLLPLDAKAELRAFRLSITNSTTGTQREVITRFDHEQYPMYHYVSKTESIEITQTWMCYPRSDYAFTLCPAPAPQEPGNTSGGPGLQDRSPANAPTP